MAGAGIPYYQPVAPQVPVADNTAAKIISEGTGNIVQALTAAAKLRQQQDLETRKMAFDAATDAQKFGLEKEKQAQDFVISQKHNEIMSEYYGSLGAAAITNAEANKTSRQVALFKLTQDNKKRADSDAQLAGFQANVDARAKELNLDDPEYQTKNPIAFAANLQKFKDEYGQALPYTGVPQRIASWQTMADQQKIPVFYGATFDPSGGPVVGGKPQGRWETSGATQVPIWQIVRDLKDPDKMDYTYNALAAAGHVNTAQSTTDYPVKDVNGNPVTTWKGGQKMQGVPTTSMTFDSLLSDVMKKGKNVDFSPSTSRLPTFVPRETRSQAMKDGGGLYDPNTSNAGKASPQAVQDASDQLNNEAPLPAEDPTIEPPPLPDTSAAPPVAEPTQTDIYLDHARKAIAAGAPADSVKQRLQQMGIDPGALAA